MSGSASHCIGRDDMSREIAIYSILTALWFDAGEAFNLAKAAGSKLTNSIVEAGSKLIPQKREEPLQQDWRQGANEDPYDSLFRRRESPYGRRGGLARSDPVNDLFGSIFKGLGETFTYVLISQRSKASLIRACYKRFCPSNNAITPYRIMPVTSLDRSLVPQILSKPSPGLGSQDM